jgi:hypothetical protein
MRIRERKREASENLAENEEADRTATRSSLSLRLTTKT